MYLKLHVLWVTAIALFLTFVTLRQIVPALVNAHSDILFYIAMLLYPLVLTMWVYLWVKVYRPVITGEVR